MTNGGRLRWCQVLSFEGHKHCTTEGCENPLHLESVKRAKRRPHSFPREWWDQERGRVKNFDYKSSPVTPKPKRGSYGGLA